jgi:CheY-like chemotaxis protein
MSLPKVLVVEDDLLSIEVIKIVLKDICELDFAENGFKAIDFAKGRKYALILMDVGLGYGINGMEATQEIRKIDGYNNTPIVALTAYAMAGDKEKFLSQGMTHYLSKPYEVKDLQNLVKSILKEISNTGSNSSH